LPLAASIKLVPVITDAACGRIWVCAGLADWPRRHPLQAFRRLAAPLSMTGG